MEVLKVEGGERERQWNELIGQSRGAVVQHSLALRDALAKAYSNLQPAYYLMEDANSACGFSAFYAKSILFSNRVVSLPFLDYGGFLGTPGHSDIALLVSKLRASFGTDKIEVRLSSQHPQFKALEKSLLGNGFSKSASRHVAVLELTSEQEIFDGFTRHVRKNINKAERSGLQMRMMDSQKELDAFYAQYFSSMKEFGTPAHSKKYFESLRQELSKTECFHGFNCYFGEELAGSMIMLSGGDTVILPYNVSPRKFREYRPNDYLHWTAIRHALKLGARHFDLGLAQADAAEGSHAYGMLEFKLKLGCKLFERPIYYHGKAAGENGPQASGGAASEMGRFKKLAGLWSKLPDALVSRLGPWVRSQSCV